MNTKRALIPLLALASVALAACDVPWEPELSVGETASGIDCTPTLQNVWLQIDNPPEPWGPAEMIVHDYGWHTVGDGEPNASFDGVQSYDFVQDDGGTVFTIPAPTPTMFFGSHAIAHLPKTYTGTLVVSMDVGWRSIAGGPQPEVHRHITTARINVQGC